MQAAPLSPQAPLAVPALHWLFSQQPFGQLAGVQTQLLSAPHSVPAGQLMQATPPDPQAVFAEPLLHAPFSQHPFAQLAGVQTQL
jgi:hypothetical protein